jgi:hypothetical protein
LSIDSHAQTPDSVTYRTDGSIAQKKYLLGSEQEIRYYNSFGFLCFSVKKDSAGRFIHCNGRVKKEFNADVGIDPVFLSDTFALGFANRVELLRDSLTISESFNRTVRYYFDRKSCFSDTDSELENIKNFGDENCNTDVYTDRPTILEDWFSIVKKEILKSIAFSEIERKDNHNKLLILVNLDTGGMKVNLRLLSMLTQENTSKINYRLERLRTLPLIKLSSARYRVGSVRGAFYIYMN